MGDIAYVRKKGGVIARTAYYSGWRPTIRTSLRAACPEIAALIEEMWLADFRARPAMKSVVVRLKACTDVDGATKGEARQGDPDNHSILSQQIDQAAGNNGQLMEQSGGSAVALIATLRAENEAAKAEIKTLKTANKAENEALKAENNALQAENDALKERIQF